MEVSVGAIRIGLEAMLGERSKDKALNSGPIVTRKADAGSAVHRKPTLLDQGHLAISTLLDLAESREQNAEESLSMRDLSAKLLSRLPDDDRALLQMLYADEMSVAEIAGLLGWSQSKVKIRAWRARNALRRVMGQYL